MDPVNTVSFEDFEANTRSRHNALPEDAPAPSVEDASRTTRAKVSTLKKQPRKVAATRRSRTRVWPEKSDVHEIISSFRDHNARYGNVVVEIQPGADSGRNMMAIFEDKGEEPRLRYNLKVKQGKDIQVLPGWKTHEEANVPMGTTLTEMCLYYPLHVWGDCLRIFIAEGWTGKQIWDATPPPARNHAQIRPWNYVQQAMGREADKIQEEISGMKRVIEKRATLKRKQEDLDNEEKIAVESAAIDMLANAPEAISVDAVPFFSPTISAFGQNLPVLATPQLHNIYQQRHNIPLTRSQAV